MLFGISGLVAGVILSASYYWFIFSMAHISTNNSYIEADIMPINARLMGFVKEVLVEENQQVKKGQPLMHLDDTDIQVELGFKQAKHKKALSDVERARTLAKSHMISKMDLENAEAAFSAADADLNGTLLKEKFTEIVAPVDGTVGKQSVHEGQFIQPGQSLMLLVSNKAVWVKANYKETQILKVRRGMAVEMVVDTFPDVTLHGRVESIYPTSGSNLSLIPPENATGNFTKIVQRIPVKIALDPHPGIELRPGMSVLTTIIAR